MTLAPIPGSFRPGGPTQPRPVDMNAAAQKAAWQFLTAEERATATLMGFFEQARLDLETFIREGDLSVSDSTFYRQLLDETNRIGSKLNKLGAEWTSSTIPEAYSSGWRTWSSVIVPQQALEALSKSTLGLIRQTTDGIRDSIRGSIAAGILEGLSGESIRQRILASGLTNIPHWPSVEYRAGVIARTETMTAYNAGSLAGIEANGARFVRWLTSPDEAVCPKCAPRDHVVFRIGEGDLVNDPYPSALPLPKIPAHPRCRCTIRAEYRDPEGNVIRATAPETEPKLPTDAMGGKDPPVVPPAAGDMQKAFGGISNDLKLWLEGGEAGTARRAFWRSLGKLDDDALKILTSTGTKAQIAERMDAFMRLRYGIRYVDKAGMTAHLRLQTARALELIRSVDQRHVVDNPYLLVIGDKPPGAKKFGRGVLARAFLTGHIEWNPSLSKQYVDKFLRMIDDGSFEVIVHELMHTAHYQRGAYAGNVYGGGIRLRPDGSDAYNPKVAADDNADWRRIRQSSHGVSPSTASISQLDAQIALFEAAIARDEASTFGGGMATIRNKSNLRLLQDRRAKAAAALADPPDHEFYPTEYARENDLEDFAESATMYLLDPARLQRYSPARYEFIRTRVFGASE